MAAPGTILLIEDGDYDAMLIRQAFRKARIANPIFHVTTGADALSYLEGAGPYKDRSLHPLPEFVLLDWILPDTLGHLVIQRIRAMHHVSTLPVVVVTGSDHPTARQDAQSSGANAFFRKALQFEDLIEMVRRVGGQWKLAVPA